MPRTYKRKTDAGSVPHGAMLEAVELVVTSELSVRKVAKEKGLSKSVLARYVQKYKKDKGCRMSPNYTHSQVFTDEQEKSLEVYLGNCSKMFHGLTPHKVRALAFEMAKVNSFPMPKKWVENKLAGADWLNAFLKRHPGLSIRCPEATSVARATAFNPFNISAFFDVLEPVIKRLNSGGRVIYNLDETGCTTVQKVPKVVAIKGCKQVGQVTSRERGELVTMCAIVSATGNTIPPAFIFPRKNFRECLMSGAPEGSLGLAYPSGWMTSDNFLKVLEHVVKNTNCSQENQIILTMDNHDSHIAWDSVVFAKDHGINIVTLPPHTSNRTQPLDLSVFGPFKSFFNKAADSWMLKHPGKTITIYQMAELMGTAWQKAATLLNITAGFRVSGIWPFDRNAFDMAGYLPSTVTDRELPEKEPMSVDLPVVNNVSGIDQSPAIIDEGAVGVQNSEGAVGAQNSESLPTPVSGSAMPTPVRPSSHSASASSYMSPEDFRGYPKVSFVFNWPVGPLRGDFC